MFRKKNILLFVCISAIPLALFAAELSTMAVPRQKVVTPRSPADSLYAEINADISVTSNSYVDIPGLSLTLPAGTSTRKTALIILNVPNPFATGNNFPGIDFGLNVDGTIVARGSFTYISQVPQSFARVPFTLVKRVNLPLNRSTQVRAQWLGIRGSTGRIDSFSSLSAIISNSN